MRKLIVIAIALISIQAIAQTERRDRPERAQKMSNLSAEEMATLRTKKMTLFLDLNESQQKEIHKINLENATLHKTMMEERKTRKSNGTAQRPTKEERLKLENAKLDRKIAMKAKMKKILDKEQYARWEKAQLKMASKRKDKKRGMNRKK
ncbi:hypothetical protein [Flavivirga rizhaonensis]|uniref:DUF4890 domain-containing protein n=1 Tax=Flavivirga rizhaonensis TaxID=2559571 RepID=A0A4S1DTU0_9FLAO|nr:hypothetical protein [Flavivirga rizhaonensis]TGV01369.1 hypothetical protein EM932_15680 [Flavivirga rizhaonensis]